MRYFRILLSVSTVSTVFTSEPRASSGRFSSIFLSLSAYTWKSPAMLFSTLYFSVTKWFFLLLGEICPDSQTFLSSNTQDREETVLCSKEEWQNCDCRCNGKCKDNLPTHCVAWAVLTHPARNFIFDIILCHPYKSKYDSPQNICLGLFEFSPPPWGGVITYDTVSDHLESLSTSVIKILTACRLNGQCSGLYG